MIRPSGPLIAAGLLLLATPIALIGLRTLPVAPPLPIAPDPIRPSSVASLDRAMLRSLFSASGTEELPAEAIEEADVGGGSGDAPALVGIVGRLPDAAVAMVRRASGGTRTLAPGESVDGWRLESLAATAALFVKGDRRVRAELPAGE